MTSPISSATVSTIQVGTVVSSTPGRICLFGEHQDYLGLPVIAAAISRRIQVTAHPTATPEVVLHLPDIGATERFRFDGQPLTYARDRDYFRSAINILLREGFTFSRGIEGEVRGNIPINSGTSSSSALLVTWIDVLTQLADTPRALAPMTLAELAYTAEVLEFGEPGGMMDQYTTAVGNVIYLASQPAIALEQLHPNLGAFVLGDSQEPKDTVGILGRTKYAMFAILERLSAVNPSFSLHTSASTDAAEFKDLLTKDEYILLKGNLANRDILRDALAVLRPHNDPALGGVPERGPALPLDHVRLGQLLTDHQTYLRDALHISTPKIDRMLTAALDAGALGGKINGSGGGGCMFAYAPENPEAVAEAIEQQGGKAYVIRVDEGTRH